ncbi:MAG: SirB2 family protein [Burkholderiaceae bacterium]|nr:SirB2 family protein [Burkholderiaceae bacterium]
MDHSTLRAIHIGCVAISIGLFVLRGAMQGAGIDWRRWRWLRIAPHANDAALLTAAIALAVTTAQYPFVQPWLTAKVIALCVYVVLGRIALRRDAPPRTRARAFVAAGVSVGYIVGVATTRSASLGLM